MRQTAGQRTFWKDKRVVVTGSSGFLGGYVTRRIRALGPKNLDTPRSAECDLRSLSAATELLTGADLVINLAAVVGGIGFNQKHPGRIYYDNLVINTNVMEAARIAGVGKIVTIGSVCAYPKILPLPFTEDRIWDGYPEETNAPYGVVKRMLLVQAQAYRAEYGMNAIHLIPCNLYGPGDKSDPENSHVIPALIRKFLTAASLHAPSVEVWGTGTASREFLYADDAAEAILLAAERYNGGEPVNLGSGSEIYIRDLVGMISKLTGFEGKIVWNAGRPDGQPRRMIDVSRAKREFGFTAKTPFETGLTETIRWYRNEVFEAVR